jgi:hypothetical protein
MHGAKAAGAGSSAQKGDFVNEDKSSTGCCLMERIAYPCSFGPFWSSGRSRGSGSVPCRESSSLAAGPGQPLRPVVCVTGGKKKTIQGQKHARIDPFMQRRGSVTQHYEHLLEIEK